MISYLIASEDLIIKIDQESADSNRVEISNPSANAHCTTVWTDSELGAVLALHTGLGEALFEKKLTFRDGDIRAVDADGALTALYAIANPLFRELPVECRIIP